MKPGLGNKMKFGDKRQKKKSQGAGGGNKEGDREEDAGKNGTRRHTRVLHQHTQDGMKPQQLPGRTGSVRQSKRKKTGRGS